MLIISFLIIRVFCTMSMLHKVRLLTNISIYKCSDVCKTVHHKQLQTWENDEWKIHHDISPLHSAQLVQQFLVKHCIPQVRRPPSKADTTLYDFFLFPKFKRTWKMSLWCQNNWTWCNKADAGNSERVIWEVLPALAKIVEEVCLCWRSLLWRGFTMHSSKFRILVVSLYSFWTGLILFQIHIQICLSLFYNTLNFLHNYCIVN